MNSPYFTGAAPNFGPPSGMAGLISQDRSSQMDTSGFKQFADVAEKFKRQQDAGKAAEFFVKASQQPDGTNPVLDSMGIHPEQWKTLGAGDKTNAVQGVVQAQAQKNVMQQFADVAAQAHERDAQAQAMSDTGDFLRSYAGDLPSETEDTPQNRLAMALHSLRPGASIGRVFPQAMNSLEKFATIGANGKPTFFKPSDKPKPIDGADGWLSVPTGPNTSQLIYAGNDVGKMLPANDEDGNLIGHVTRDAKGNVKVTPFKGGAILKPATDGNGNVLEGFYITQQGKTVDSRTAIQKMTGEAPTAGPKYKSADEVKAAVKSGALSKDAGVKMLREQFGYQ